MKKQYVKVVDSTCNTSEEKKQMIGGVYEVQSIYFDDSKVRVWNEDKSWRWTFNLSDVQFCVLDEKGEPAKVGGEHVCIGDSYEGDEIVDSFIYDYGIKIVVKTSDSVYYAFAISNLKKSEFIPKFKPVPKETVSIAGRLYDKAEFEEAVRDLKEIK